MSNTQHSPPGDEPLQPGRTLLGGVLMGLANLVPGVSGGTMILVCGLYDRFVVSVADVTRLRLRMPSLLFLGVMGIGAVTSILLGSGVAVGLVRDHRWVMYSLFVGMTLGGVPLLVRLSRPWSPAVFLGFAAGLGLMVAYALEIFETKLPETAPFFVLAGAAAATSMVLPGISGAYVLLILGLYELIVGSASVSVLRENPAESARILVPVAIGAGLGVALLTNLLKVMLARFSGPVHGALLGLLIGSVFGLYPFKEPVHPELADRGTRKAVTMLVAGANMSEVRARHDDLALTDEDLAKLSFQFAGQSGADIKRSADATERYTPELVQVASALGLLVAGFLFTQLLGRRDKSA